MKDSKEHISGLFDLLKEYMQTQMDIITLTLTNQLANIAAALTGKLIFIAFFISGVFFASVALAFYIGEQTGDAFKGFAIVAAGYFIVGIIALLIRSSWVKSVFLKMFAQQLYNNEP